MTNVFTFEGGKFTLSAQESDLAHFVGNGTIVKILSEIKPPLEGKQSTSISKAETNKKQVLLYAVLYFVCCRNKCRCTCDLRMVQISIENFLAQLSLFFSFLAVHTQTFFITITNCFLLLHRSSYKKINLLFIFQNCIIAKKS